MAPVDILSINLIFEWKTRMQSKHCIVIEESFEKNGLKNIKKNSRKLLVAVHF